MLSMPPSQHIHKLTYMYIYIYNAHTLCGENPREREQEKETEEIYSYTYTPMCIYIYISNTHPHLHMAHTNPPWSPWRERNRKVLWSYLPHDLKRGTVRRRAERVDGCVMLIYSTYGSHLTLTLTHSTTHIRFLKEQSGEKPREEEEIGLRERTGQRRHVGERGIQLG